MKVYITITGVCASNFQFSKIKGSLHFEFAVRSGRCRQVSPLGCSKGTEQEDVSASGEFVYRAIFPLLFFSLCGLREICSFDMNWQQ